MRSRAPVGLVALLVLGLGLTIDVGDAPRAAAATIAAPHAAIGGCVVDWTIDAPEFDAPAAPRLAAPARLTLPAAPPPPLVGAAPRAHLLRLAPKTSPPRSPVLHHPRTRRSHDHGRAL